MNHHAYVWAGKKEAGIDAARRRSALLGIPHADILTLQFPLLSVEHAREVNEHVYRAPLVGDAKAVIISAERLFHEAQNALLKTFEEPPHGTYLFLIVPSEGLLLPTLRSRLVVLEPSALQEETDSTLASTVSSDALAKKFILGTEEEREHIIEDILARAKSDREEEKQRSRTEARLLAEGLMKAAYTKKSTIHGSALPSHEVHDEHDLIAFLQDLEVFVPILYERSAPLKPILEHIRIALPRSLAN
jgi:DNA polymerase III delta prime subunit